MAVVIDDITRNRMDGDDAEQWETEQSILTECMAKFACFLQANAQTDYNDPYEEYLTYLITSTNDDPNDNILARQINLDNYMDSKSALEEGTEGC